MSLLKRVRWACGCCAVPALDYAEISTKAGMVAITTDHADEVDEYTVREYDQRNALVQEQVLSAGQVDALLAGKTLTGQQIYLCPLDEAA